MTSLRIGLAEPALVFLCADEDTRDLMAARLPGWICTTEEDLFASPRLLVRWGVPGHRDGDRTYNLSAAVSRAMKPELVSRFWSLYRLPAKPVSEWGKRPPISRRERTHWLYRVCVFDLRLIGVQVVYRHPKGAKRPALPRLQDRLLHLARRALYVLGLHGGAVDIWVGPQGPGSSPSLALAGISAGPRLTPEWADALAALLMAAAQGSGAESFGADAYTLGADPEFVILKPGTPEKVIPASSFFPARAGVGTDRVTGLPGRPLGELRPAPSPSPLQLLEALREGLAHAGRRLKGKPYVLRAGGYPAPHLPTGGHIHFGRLKPDTDTLKLLDAFLAIPLFLLEDPDKARLRREKGYGTWGDYRPQPHGFEYRALSSWLVHPRVALAALCLAKTVVAERDYLRRHIPPCLGTLSAHRRFLRGETGMFYRLFPLLWRTLQATPTYRRYEPELRYLETAISQRSNWNETRPLLGAWNVAH